MDDEIKQLKKRDLGAKAQRLKDDALLNAIFEGLKNQYMREWAQTEPGDEKVREQKWLQLHALLDVRAQLNAICADGRAASAFLEEAERTKAAA